ncbi:hypothetical protein OG413_44905 [Streptomyces sp. NBC_01433]|uniref:hypothetical protein n=1 Tax=Streptomyces sp. NBC_01433 TaxID=2903864 RepID=UPI00225B5392|nr:hypothetical protein [Streptomyces sp. NBC_01433]MCX4682326.1 hypothetical protein [Streptomyces sp. NBC_01433]
MSSSRIHRGKEPSGPAADGCCAGCPLSDTCSLADPVLARCAVTGAVPPPEPPHDPPSVTAGTDLDLTEVVSRGVEKAVGAAFGLGWTDLLAAVIERTNSVDSEGNPVDWGRLQLPRNLLCLAVANIVPIQGAPASRWAADAFTGYGLAALLIPTGAVLTVAGAVCIGTLVGGPIGLLCSAALTVAKGAGQLTWRLICSRLGWIITRPLIWAGVSGLLIITWRALVRLLTGA